MAVEQRHWQRVKLSRTSLVALRFFYGVAVTIIVEIDPRRLSPARKDTLRPNQWFVFAKDKTILRLGPW
jgi:hypothetical protein